MILKPHHFHIPVMGIGYTVDTPVKVAHLGIDSVISLVDDMVIEKMRSYHCRISKRKYDPIGIKENDYRARRISAYLNLLQEIALEKFNALYSQNYEPGTELYKYVSMLPEDAEIKAQLRYYADLNIQDKEFLQAIIKDKLVMGSIDVNIMSKGDTVRYKSGEKLPAEFNDAHAAVRGFFKSNLQNSSLIISAGLNPKLFTYIGTFEEALPDKNGVFNKKITIKVSDYRSALVQGKFLAQRGVWVSEFRIESGLNCGGHAFATKGFFLGPILEEFMQKRDEMECELREIYKKAVFEKNGSATIDPPAIRYSAQGGIGTYNEAEFLRNRYNLSSVGWGSPFLLVPEVVNIDQETLTLVANAKEDAIYLSDTSPFGIPFYTVRGNSKDQEKLFRIQHNVPGSTCPKRFVALNTEFGEPALCTASREYQKQKIDQIKNQNSDAALQNYLIEKVTAKTCVCVGLGTAALLVNGLERKLEGSAVSICPGPNMAYFSEKVSLEKMVDHIYGRMNLISHTERPHVFLKEIRLYLDYIKTHLLSLPDADSEKQKTYLHEFKENMLSGISYYEKIFQETIALPPHENEHFIKSLSKLKDEIIASNSDQKLHQFA